MRINKAGQQSATLKINSSGLFACAVDNVGKFTDGNNPTVFDRKRINSLRRIACHGDNRSTGIDRRRLNFFGCSWRGVFGTHKRQCRNDEQRITHKNAYNNRGIWQSARRLGRL